jgi:hypothetical protein
MEEKKCSVSLIKKGEGSTMDYTSILIIIAFLGYGVFQYQRRDREYRAMILQMARGETPVRKSEQPALWKLTALGGVSVLVAGFAIGCFLGVLKRAQAVFMIPMTLIGVFSLIILVLLVLMFVRDLRAFRASQKTR